MTKQIFLSSSPDSTIKIWNLELSKTSLQTIECAQNEPRNLRKINETKFACLFDNGLIKKFHSDKETFYSSVTKRFHTILVIIEI